MSPSPSKRAAEPGDLIKDPGYSLRRYYVDVFQLAQAPGFEAGGRVLNLGGLKVRRRGLFRIEPYGFEVIHLNLSPGLKPEVVGDGAELPFAGSSFEAVLMAEVLEHVAEPGRVVREAARVLKPGGRLLITVPFHNPIHPDPLDFGRYTETWLRRELERAGLEPLLIQAQGRFLSVLADLGREWFLNRRRQGLWGRVAGRLGRWGLVRLRRAALARDGREESAIPAYQLRYTTGYGVVARKR